MISDDSNKPSFARGVAVRHWRSWLSERLTPLGLTQTQWTVLCQLVDAGGTLAQHELGMLTGLEGPALVRLLGTMERLSLIERHEARSDRGRRIKTVQLGDKAAPIVARMGGWADRLRGEVLDGVSDREIAVLRKVLDNISGNLAHLNP
jgi:DNA-binding MarR family transcriptional regulator